LQAASPAISSGLKNAYGRLLDATLAARSGGGTRSGSGLSRRRPDVRHVPEGNWLRSRTRESSSASWTPPLTPPSTRTASFAAEVNNVFLGEPEFQLHFPGNVPNSGFRRMVVKPWDERKRTIFQILPGVQQKLQKIPGIRIFGTTPLPSPAAAISRGIRPGFTAETREILEFANQLQRKAMQSGMFAFPPLIDVKVDQPSPSSSSTGQGGLTGAQP